MTDDSVNIPVTESNPTPLSPRCQERRRLRRVSVFFSCFSASAQMDLNAQDPAQQSRATAEMKA